MKKKKIDLKWIVLLTVIIGTFLGRLDQTIVGLALPKIISDFGITVSSAGWITTAYIIANAVFVPIWGKLGDLIGRRKVYVIGFVVFIIGSVLAGFAWNLTSMVVFRVIQAIAGSADYPTAMAILVFTFHDEKERAEALGIWSAAFAAAAVFGPLIGGPLIDNFGWPSVFLLNLPVGIVGLIMALTFIKESKSEKKVSNFDWWGAIFLGIALAALVLVLEKGVTWGWTSLNSIVTYVVTIISGGLFIRTEKHHPEPIVDLKFFRKFVFINTLINNFITFMGMMSVIFVIPIFVQTFMGLGATQTGFMFLPMAAGMMMTAPFGGLIKGKFPARYIIMASSLVSAVGIFMFSFLDPKSGPLDVMLPLFIMALGMGFGMAPRTNIIASMVPSHEIGSASSVLALTRNIAGAFGIALAGTILNNSTAKYIFDIMHSSFTHATNPLEIQKFAILVNLKAQVMAYRDIFLFGAVITIIGAISAYWIKVENEKNDIEVMVE
ncbi:MAG: MDR family MFS transporter [Candidatus Berkelbacteria bacterium]